MPGETNALNNLFGGELLARMDRAASISARRHAEQIVVTSSVNNVSFGKSIPIGATVTIEAKVSRAFTTSMEVFIDVWIDDDIGKKITFDNVMLYVDGDNVEVGQPYLDNVKVTAEIKDIVKADKISILRFRRRKHSMRKIGHRAKHSQIEIKNIKLESK